MQCNKREKPLINDHGKTQRIPLVVINKLVVGSDKHSVLLFYRLPVGSGCWHCFFILNCAAWVLVSAVQQSFASDWLAGGWQQLADSWPLLSVGRQCCWVKVKLKESDRSPDFRWWSKQWPHTLNIWPVVWKAEPLPSFLLVSESLQGFILWKCINFSMLVNMSKTIRKNDRQTEYIERRWWKHGH